MPPLDRSAAREQVRGSPAAWVLAGLAILAVLALGNRPLLLGRAAPQWDAVDFFAPSFTLVGDELRAGHLVKWNPWTGAGAPDWAEPEFGTTSPPLLAASYLSINPQEGYVAYWMAIWAFAGMGMLLLTRHLGVPAWGGAIAAMGFIASGFYTGHAEHLSWLYAVSFIPWMLWRLDAGLQNRRWWCGVQAGALYGLSALGGYPAFTIVTPGFLFLWVVGRVAWPEGEAGTRRPAVGRAAALLALTAVVGSLIASVPYGGLLLDTRGYNEIAGPRPRDVSISSDLLEAGALSTFASPYLANLNVPPHKLWPRTDISLTSVYTGAGSLILACFACTCFARGRRSAWRWWLALMGALALACALGSQLPLRGWLYDLVPPMRYFRHAALFRAYAIVIAAVLAALATRDLASAQVPASDRRRLWALALFWACAGTVSFAVVNRIAAKSASQSLAALLPAALHLVVVWFGFAALAFFFKRGRLSPARFLQFAAALAFCDAVGALHISQPAMYTSATLPWWHAMNAGHNASVDLSAAGWARTLKGPEFLGTYLNNRNVVLKTSVLDSYVAFWDRSMDGSARPPQDFRVAFSADPMLNQMALGNQRLWFSTEAVARAPDPATFRLFDERVHALAGRPILVLHSPQQMLALGDRPRQAHSDASPPIPEIPACVPATVSDLVYRPDSLSFRYTAPAHGFLMVTDRWADGWEASVNGQRRPVLGADFIFRAVEVEAGVNDVEFNYNPKGFRPLLWVSWGTLALIAAGQCLRFRYSG